MGSSFSTQGKKVDQGDSITNGLYSNVAQDYDQKVVRNLVTSRKLAPFYKGLDQVDLETTKDDPPCSLYKDAVECPICFLYYPSNINYSKCCDQPICTECFVQIKRIDPHIPTTCPFCVHPHFGVIYQPKKRHWSLFSCHSSSRSMVLVDRIRPDPVDTSLPLRQYYATDRAMATPSFEDWMVMEAVRRSLQDQP